MLSKDTGPELTFPEAEAAVVLASYREAGVILEYGSGGSTWCAAHMPGKRIFSVESDRRWALDLEARIELASPPSPVTLHHVDIGKTGRWGRPIDDSRWTNFYSYPTSIWHQNYFRHPDVVLIDGRLRPACLVACCLFAQAEMTILFDDYTNRPRYTVIESIIKPVDIVGRMAKFEVTPRSWGAREVSFLTELCGHMTYAGGGGDEHAAFYATPVSSVMGP